MLKAHEKSHEDTARLMAEIGSEARAAARPLAIASAERKHAALIGMAEAIIRCKYEILTANAVDVKNSEEAGLSGSFMDRLKLTPSRIRDMADSIRAIAELRDPVGEVIAEWDMPNGLHIERVRTPLGVIGVIYESRPNVTADAGALCLKAGNPVILRGGSGSLNSSRVIHACLVEGLKSANLPEKAIQLVPVANHATVSEMLKGLSGNLDVIIPRGGRSLVERVHNDARVPIFAHLEGICHLYIDKSARLDLAINIAVNAKMRRTGICGAAETLLVDRGVASTHLVPVLEALHKAGCEIHADEEVLAAFADAKPATDADWVTEYLDAIISVKLIDGVAGAIEHIETFSSHHTEAIVAEDARAVERFFKEIDSAILLHNASTQFADGGEFGMGAEIGIATGKMHARGPVGVEQLTSFKYRVHGNGQIRP